MKTYSPISSWSSRLDDMMISFILVYLIFHLLTILINWKLLNQINFIITRNNYITTVCS